MSTIGQAPIHVTRTFMPPRAEYLAWLDQALDSHVLTNQGPLHNRLETALRERFSVPHLKLMANGTLAIQLALRALEVKGKVITTPYSYVATTSAILWEGLEPVYVDVDPRTGCIDASLIEAAITPEVTAILATHVYGIPCDVEAIDAIAKRHGLKVIYDAAHAFDVMWKGRSILQWGDASTLSFHATKLFHTVEGGATIVHDQAVLDRLHLLRQFGHIGDTHHVLGINAKMSEPHAAMGLAMLPWMEHVIAERAHLGERYDEAFAGLGIERPRIPEGAVYNHAYYPVFFPDGDTRERVLAGSAALGVHARRYFYPSLDTLPYVHATPCPVSRSAAERVLCLPLYAGLSEADQDRVISGIRALLA